MKTYNPHLLPRPKRTAHNAATDPRQSERHPMKTSPLLRRGLLGAFVSLLTAGCAGPVATTGEGTPPQVVTTEYKQVFVTGSHIPVLVPTSPTARTPPTVSPLVIITPDDMKRLPGGGPMR